MKIGQSSPGKIQPGRGEGRASSGTQIQIRKEPCYWWRQEGRRCQLRKEDKWRQAALILLLNSIRQGSEQSHGQEKELLLRNTNLLGNHLLRQEKRLR